MFSAFVISQLVVGIAFVLGLSSFQFKNRTHTLLLLGVAQLLNGLHFFILGATTAGFMLLLSAVRLVTGTYTKKRWVMFGFIFFSSCNRYSHV